MPHPGAGTVTFLFTDIERSTELLRRLRGEYEDVLAGHHRLLRAAVDRAGGDEVDNQGDSFFFAFRTASDAVNAAADAQRELARHSWPAGAELRVRMGVHSGDARRSERRYVGLAVHRAARISAAGHGGQILLSQATYELLADEEEELSGVRFRDLGEHRLKDFERAVRLYQVVGSGLADDFPPLRTAEGQAEASTPLEEGATDLVDASPGGPRSRSRGLVLALAAAIVTAVVLAVGGFLVSREDDTRAGAADVRVQPDSLVAIDPGTSRVASVVEVAGSPGPVVFAGGAVWVLNESERTITRVDATTRETTTIPTGLDYPCCLAAERSGAVWVSGYGTDEVRRLGPVTLQPDRILRVGLPVHGSQYVGGLPRLQNLVAVGGGSLWLVHPSAGRLRRVSLRTGKVVADHRVDPLPFAVTFGEGSAWVSSYGGDSVLEIRASDDVVRRIAVPGGPAGTAVAGEALWVSSYSDGSVRRVERTNGAITDVVHVGKASAVTVRFHEVEQAFGAIWATYGEETLVRIDDEDRGQVTRIDLGHRAGGIATGAGRVWVSVQAPAA